MGTGALFGSTTYLLDPLSSFVLADTGTGQGGYLPDTPDNPLWVAVKPNTTITIVAVGDICYAGTDPQGTLDSPCYAIGGGHNISAPASQAELGAVFANSYQLLPDDQQQRVPGAVASGQPAYTDPYYTTFYFNRNVSTVNPFDFLIPYGVGITLTVPANANFLVLGVFDSYYGDNSDPSGTLGVQITGFSAEVPEPGPAGLMVAALGGMLALRRVISRRS
jgi:hypothetical protein